jgi:predicted phosphate transport protein (TIGR00153 family)
MFSEISSKAQQCAIKLEELMNDLSDMDNKVNAIEKIEHECDEHIHNIFFCLHKSFITPIDREDIHLISKELDNIVDAIETIAHKLQMYSITYIRKEAFDMVKLIIQSTIDLTQLMLAMNELKKVDIMKKHIIEINRLENLGDGIFRNAMKNLFDNETNPIEIIKWKSIFEKLENAIDYCEDVANIVEGVVMKHA